MAPGHAVYKMAAGRTSQEEVAPALGVQGAEREAQEDHGGAQEGRDDDAAERKPQEESQKQLHGEKGTRLATTARPTWDWMPLQFYNDLYYLTFFFLLYMI